MMANIDRILIKKEYTIREAMKVLDLGAKGIVFVVDDNKRLIGSITDGDIRRAILKDVSLDSPIESIMNSNPISAKNTCTRDEIKDIFIRRAVRQIPILDKDDVVIDMVTINDILLPEGKENPVVIMAGGLGTRLKELTEEIPKPMLKVGNDPILHHIINNFKQYGYNKIFISVNYRAEVIENYFQDGYAYGVKIEYIKEEERLGTAGGISLARSCLDKPFFVINGDILTNLNVEDMMNFHIDGNYDITVGVRSHDFQIPYGIVKVNNSSIEGITEKPILNYYINGGIYCLNPEVVDIIPKGICYDITELIHSCINRGLRVGSYEIKDYWMDIGKIDDYNKANEDIYKVTNNGRNGDLDDRW